MKHALTWFGLGACLAIGFAVGVHLVFVTCEALEDEHLFI